MSGCSGGGSVGSGSQSSSASLSPSPSATRSYVGEYDRFMKDLKTVAGFLPLDRWKTEDSDPQKQDPWVYDPVHIGFPYAPGGSPEQRFEMSILTKGLGPVLYPDPDAAALKFQQYLRSHGFDSGESVHLGNDPDHPAADFGAKSPSGNTFSIQVSKYGIVIDAYGFYFIPDGSLDKLNETPEPPHFDK